MVTVAAFAKSYPAVYLSSLLLAALSKVIVLLLALFVFFSVLVLASTDDGVEKASKASMLRKL